MLVVQAEEGLVLTFEKALRLGAFFAIVLLLHCSIKKDLDSSNTIKSIKDCSLCPELVIVPAGRFSMGSAESESLRENDEGPQHEVTIPSSFAVGKFEVTYGEFRRYAEANKLERQLWNIAGREDPNNDRYPVFFVSWYEAQAYVKWLSEMTGHNYRLLSEAEWEYVARARTNKMFEENVGAVNPPKYVAEWWKYANSHTVGSSRPNAFGVYDMTENVQEWVQDCYISNYSTAPLDGSAIGGDCMKRVVRGASNYSQPRYKRLANRDWAFALSNGNPIGFRVARSVP